MTTTGWAVSLNGVALTGGEAPSGLDNIVGCIDSAPDGLGVPALRVEDVTFPQRDGVQHFSDWYEARILTMPGVSVCPDGCPGCPTARQKVSDLSLAWSRYCDDTELVIFTDCHDPDSAVTGTDRAVIGPYGVIGRPRVASGNWLQGKTGCWSGLLRFDAVDHRMYVLDAAGTPGSGEQCLSLAPEVDINCRTYPRCYDLCSPGVTGWSYSTPITGTANPGELDNFGTLCAYPTITFTGSLTSPTVENVTTGESFTYTGNVTGTVVVNTMDGTAVDQDGNPVTYLLEGDTTMSLDIGVNTLRLTSLGPNDTGTMSACFRPAVLTG